MRFNFILFFPILTAAIANIEHPTVELKDGKVKGKSLETDSGKKFHAFRGIPYASPPIGELRFKEPVPPLKWDGIKDATENTKICLQRQGSDKYQKKDPRENEDCLYINVFTPRLSNLTGSPLLPIYVYIHGGRMAAGTPTEYDFQGFLDEDIIIVTMSFRLSALGCLSTQDGVIPGNLFLKDQILALKWVNKNIEYFGGDPAKVTIGGHSSGACCAGLHVLNTGIKGLFRAAILQSGSALNQYHINATEIAYTVAETFDPAIYSKNTDQLLRFLQTLPADELINTKPKHLPDWLGSEEIQGKTLYGFVTEDSKFENAAITGPMHENYENGSTNHVPLLLGITSEEASNMNISEAQPNVDINLMSIIDPTWNVRPENKLRMAEEFKNIYTKTDSFRENKTALLQLLSDLKFGIPVITTAKLHSKFADVYFYEFSHKGPLNGLEQWNNNELHNIEGIGRVAHCGELPFLYNYRIDPEIIPSQADLLVKKRLLKIWTNFIKDLNPTPKPDPLLQNVTWPKVKPNDFEYMDISVNMSVRTNPRRVVEWTNRMEKYFERPWYVF